MPWPRMMLLFLVALLIRCSGQFTAGESLGMTTVLPQAFPLSALRTRLS